MRGRRVAGAGALGLVASVAVHACGGGAFSSAPPDSGASDDGGPDVTVPETGAGEGSAGDDAGDASDAPGHAEAAAGNIVYVSPNGADTSTGLSPLSPKRTIAAGVAEARTLPGVPEVHVCAGVYAETKLSISDDVVLLGAYNCSTWVRTATYGFPTFDGTNQTTIQNAQVTGQSSTLAFNGAVTSATVVDGFLVAGGASANLTVYGVHVGGGASPLLTNDIVVGGSGAGGTTAVGSAGVLVDGTAAPEITACEIDGGSGSGSVGSIGVDLNTTGAVKLHDAAISGGSGTLATSNNSFAAAGVRIRSSLSTTSPLLLLVIAGSGMNGAAGKTVGVFVDGSGVSAGIAVSDISGGTSTTAQTYGVYVTAAGGTVDLADDRIYGGVTKASPGQSYGVMVTTAGALLVANSMIHAGTVPSSGGSSAVGLSLASVAAPAIAYDTIYTGSSAGTAIALNAGVTGALMTDNLLVGSDTGSGNFGVTATACAGVVTTLDHTAFANFPAIYQCPGEGGAVDAQSIADLAAALGGPQTAGDVTLQKTCPGTSGCAVVAACPSSGQSCQSALFGPAWTGDGIPGLQPTAFTDGGLTSGDWSLAPGSPCVVTKGAVPVNGIAADIDGRSRSTTTPTMGAVEYAAATPCN